MNLILQKKWWESSRKVEVFPPPACHRSLSSSECAALSGNKAAQPTRIWLHLELVKLLWCALRSKWGFVCVCVCAVCDILTMACSGCSRLVYSVQLSAAVFPSFFFSSDDTHFHSVPFRPKFLWPQPPVLATANCLSMWLNCGSK